MQSYLSDRSQRVKLGNIYSSWTGVEAGVPQSSILGPMLFNVFINDLAYAIKQCELPGYADDIEIYLSNNNLWFVEERINRDLENTMNWFQQNSMMVNPVKYQTLVLGKTDYEMVFKCTGDLIPISTDKK